MPIFVYEPAIESQSEVHASESRDCCHFEVLQWSSEAPLLVCPTCGGSVRRALTEFSTQARTANTHSRNDSGAHTSG